MQRVLALLKSHGDKIPAEIAGPAAVALNTLTKGGLLRAMQRDSHIHVCGWRPPARSGNWAPIWRAGAGRSVPKPPRAHNTVTANRWRDKGGRAKVAAQRKAVRTVRTTVRKINQRKLPASLSLAGLLGIGR